MYLITYLRINWLKNRLLRTQFLLNIKNFCIFNSHFLFPHHIIDNSDYMIDMNCCHKIIQIYKENSQKLMDQCRIYRMSHSFNIYQSNYLHINYFRSMCLSIDFHLNIWDLNTLNNHFLIPHCIEDISDGKLNKKYHF